MTTSPDVQINTSVDISEGQTPLQSDYNRVRKASELLCQPLETEDYGIQTMVDVSPPKWHLAHTSWFFETFLLKPFVDGYQEYHPQYAYLFNSYYEQVGHYFSRPQRGLLSRPTVKEVYAYRAYVDEHILKLMDTVANKDRETATQRIITGLHHEQQHQELILTDIKHIFASNPLKPVYREADYPEHQVAEMEWIKFTGGLKSIGASDDGFCYDNELPQHDVWLQPFFIASRPVTNAEYIAFIEDGGYERAELWLAEGWSAIKQGLFSSPLYWIQQDNTWWSYTLSGMKPVDLNAPACHLNYFEADAYASWLDCRLPTEDEWEVAAESQAVEGNLRNRGYFQPVADSSTKSGIRQLYGDVWEWTQSAYAPYPGYKNEPGALGEYNGKFMCGQYVLRGGSCVTPSDHIRPSYRNFFYPKDQWQFSGIRLAKDV